MSQKAWISIAPTAMADHLLLGDPKAKIFRALAQGSALSLG